MNNKKTRKRFFDLRFKYQLLLSYVLVGVIPFIIFSTLLFVQTNSYVSRSTMQSFSAVYDANVAGIKDKIEQIENTLSFVSLDKGVANVLNAEYDSDYQKYFEITNYFDSMMSTATLATPQIGDYFLYVPNNLAGSRKNIQDIEDVKNKEFYKMVENSISVQWQYENGFFYVMQKIYDNNFVGKFAILRAKIRYEDIFDPTLLKDQLFMVELNGEVLPISSFTSRTEEATNITTPIFGNLGSFDMFISHDAVDKIVYATFPLMISMVIAGFVFLLIAINLFSQGFVSRITRINTSLTNVVKDKFKVLLKVDYHDEIGQMTEYINQMITDTKSLVLDVYKSKLKQREYEIKALQAQINPHFLYNTLSAINWLAISSKNIRISEIVMALSTFYRTALNKGESITTLKNELENIQAYIQIQLNIHENSFDVEYNIEEELLNNQIPNLIIQPIVENAIEHGLDNKTEGRGLLCINIYDGGKNVIFEVVDNGVGMSQETLENLLDYQSNGYGLSNVNKRLALFFGKEFIFRFECLEVTKAFISIPKCTEIEQFNQIN